MKPILAMLLLATLGSLAVMLVVILADIGLRQGAGIIVGVWAGIAGTLAMQGLIRRKKLGDQLRSLLNHNEKDPTRQRTQTRLD